MRRLLLTVVFCAASLLCSSQDFLYDSNYVYGMGVSDDEQAAEETAMLSLSRALCTKVTNETEQYVTETSAGIEGGFNKNTRLTSNITVEGAKKYTTFEGGKYVVYCFFNKTEYVNTRIEQYAAYFNLVEEAEASNHPHSLNLMLGNLYRAYTCMDTELMMVLCPQTAPMKKHALEKMKKIYGTGGPLTAHQLTWYSMEVQQDGSPWPRFFPVAAFEYIHNGKWEYSPSRIKGYREDGSLSIEDDQSLENVVIVYSPLRERGVKYIQYRWLYEEIVNGEIIRIDVPESFYFTERVIQYF